MGSRSRRVFPLVFASGFCALVYQMVWLREFRLFFGASTAASAAVLAIFMGGLGFGSIILGKKSEGKERPLKFYAQLELTIALTAAITPVLIWLMRQIYLALGGIVSMGLGFGTVTRLLMSAVVLGVPTFMMGGTLPAVARAIVLPDDTNRRPVALLYGVNTLGAVLGTLSATFYFFEAWGNHLTLLLAAVFNVWVAFAAFQMAKDFPAVERSEPETQLDQAPAAPPAFVFLASAIAGFAFLLMELVWYRMLCALLGASAFTFGLILAVALLGIGVGGIIYAMWFHGRQITLQTFALVCAAEAFFLAVPYALGDRIALLAMLLRPLGALGFYGFVGGWTVICGIVVLPASVVAGIQFPMLIALLGKGRHQVGTHIGTTYGWNTAGAIAGSLAGGFGFLPLFSAPGVWKLVIILLSALAAAAAVINLRRRPDLAQAIVWASAITLPLLMLTAMGPTAFWRHSQIGVGRQTKYSGSKNEFHDLMNTVRRETLWEKDGVESSVALSTKSGLNFIVNGKCDGSLRGDADTQIMSGLIAAALHPRPERVLVVGLGTGSTAGWLAAVPSVERVDVFELEPAILQVAKQCAQMNHDALANPKLHVTIGDARELLLVGHNKYDLIVSEPSNPYRAGIASMFTREYYQAARKRLNDGGIFAQWVQAYEIDDSTLETVYATFHSAFSNVVTWQTEDGDLLLVGTTDSRTYNADDLRARIATEPFKTALLQTWRVTTLEGFLAHCIAGNSFAESVQRLPNVPLNTDDRTVLEFAFARNVDLHNGFRVALLRTMAALMQTDRLPISSGDVEWPQVQFGRLSMLLGLGETPNPSEYANEALRTTAAAYMNYLKGELAGALDNWRRHPREPLDLNELLMVAECSANEGALDADAYIDKLREFLPNDADAIRVRLLWQRNRPEEAAALLEDVLRRFHTDPWLSTGLAERTLKLAQQFPDHIASDSAVMGIYQALQTPFNAYACEMARFETAVLFGVKLDGGHYAKYTRAALESFEPFVPWQYKLLTVRQRCYKATNSPLAMQADLDLNKFMAAESSRLAVVPPSEKAPTGNSTPAPATWR